MFCIISDQLSPLERRFCASQIIIIKKVVDVSSVGIKKVDCSVIVSVSQIERIGYLLRAEPLCN